MTNILSKLKHEIKSMKVEHNDDFQFKIRFDSIGSGYECYHSFDYIDSSLKLVEETTFNVFSSGSNYFIKDLSKEEIESYKTARDVGDKAYTKKKKEEYAKINRDILKITEKFDKDIEAVMKKYGYTKK